MAELIIHTDGGSRGNPGQAACGVVIFDGTKQLLLEQGKYLGIMTNNEAEYEGLLLATQLVQQHPEWQAAKLIFRLDSKLVVEQTQGHWKIKEDRLRSYVMRIREQLKVLALPFQIEYVPRALNAEADACVNRALDENIPLQA
jgi:ribonuclease HI